MVLWAFLMGCHLLLGRKGAQPPSASPPSTAGAFDLESELGPLFNARAAQAKAKAKQDAFALSTLKGPTTPDELSHMREVMRTPPQTVRPKDEMYLLPVLRDGPERQYLQVRGFE